MIIEHQPNIGLSPNVDGPCNNRNEARKQSSSFTGRLEQEKIRRTKPNAPKIPQGDHNLRSYDLTHYFSGLLSRTLFFKYFVLHPREMYPSVGQSNKIYSAAQKHNADKYGTPEGTFLFQYLPEKKLKQKQKKSKQ